MAGGAPAADVDDFAGSSQPKPVNPTGATKISNAQNRGDMTINEETDMSSTDVGSGNTSNGTRFASVGDLASAMRRASVAHGAHEKLTGEADPNWPDWYAAYMVAEQAGGPLPV